MSHAQRMANDPCDISKVKFVIGKPYRSEIGQLALRASRARTLGVLQPGDPYITDHRTHRLRLMLDGEGVVRDATCG